MAKIRKIKEKELIGGTSNIEVYPITHARAVYDKNNTPLSDTLEFLNTEIVWNNSGTLSNMNDFTVAGVYNIKGERKRTDDNLPILNANPGHSFNARLTVLDSSISGSGKDDDKCITQVLSFSNRFGQGEVYIRTGKGSSLDNLIWENWSTLQRNVNVGEVGSLDDLIDNGIYSGILSTTGETFVIICINNYAIAQQVGGVRHISHLKYSLVVGTGEVKIEKRTRDGYGIWTEWENIGGGSTLPEATVDTVGGVRLGSGHFGYLPIRNINDNPYSGLGIKLGTTGREFNVVPLVLGIKPTGSYTWDTSWDMSFLGIPIDTRYFNLTDYGLTLGSGVNGDSATKVTWDANSNMNDFKIAGVYEIYGERTRQDDNLPILNASSGHSIAARLTVVASTLQPASNEICVTQFLMLSNRRGGEGNMYVRTYNENNSPAADWWTPWQKLQGIREGYIFTDSVQVNPDGGVQQITGVTGLNNMVDNGIYSGIYTDDLTFQAPTFIDTFTLIVINNYAVASKDSRLKRTISQLKYAVDAITNQASVKQRTKTDGDDKWSDWTDIGGGGSQEVDVTDTVKAAGLNYLLCNGFAKEGVVYSCKLKHEDITNNLGIFDPNKKLSNFILGKTTSDIVLKIEYKQTTSFSTAYIDVYGYSFYYKVVMYGSVFDNIHISADMTQL